MESGKIQAFYNDTEKQRSDAYSLRASLFSKRAALGETALWDAFRWGCYAGSVGRNFVAHGRWPRTPSVFGHLKQVPLQPGI
jgi:hypothetical protein